jgi:hypothetical protein
MTETAALDDDDGAFLDEPLTLKDRIEFICDDLDQAAEALDENEVAQLCRAVRKKLKDIEGDGEPVEEREEPQYWWKQD